MPSLFKSLFSGVPLGCLVIGGGLSALTGGVWWAVLGLLAAGAIVAPKHLSRRSQALEQVAAIRGAVDQGRLADLRQLSTSLTAIQGVPGAEHQALQLRDQFDGANAKYLNFRELLASKFDPNEITFGRYMKSAEQVYLSMLDGIQSAATMLNGLRAIDLDQIRAQVRMLKRKEAPSDAEARELETLESRLEIREQELERIRELLSTNEQALTTLTLAGAALTTLKTEDGRTALDADTAMRELEELAGRAERYSLEHARSDPS